MIEELEAEAVAQLVAMEHGQPRARAMLSHEGRVVEVRARRRNDHGVVLGYSCDGVRLEKAALLLLICPEPACERSQSAKRQWLDRNPPPAALQRRMRSPMKSAPSGKGVRLFEEVPVDGVKGSCVARPASFECLTTCPVNAHQPTVIRKTGWDLFRDGRYVAGGLVQADITGMKPRFDSIEAAAAWLANFGAIGMAASSGRKCT